MTLIDTSAWVEYLRATTSNAHLAVRDLLDTNGVAHTTDVVVMEVLAGGRSDRHTSDLRRLLARCGTIPVRGLDDYEAAAALYCRCRRAGEPVRALNDCLIAAVAIRAGQPVLHANRDFDVLSRHSDLRLYDPAND